MGMTRHGPISRSWLILIATLVLSCIGSMIYSHHGVTRLETPHVRQVLLQVRQDSHNHEEEDLQKVAVTKPPLLEKSESNSLPVMTSYQTYATSTKVVQSSPTTSAPTTTPELQAIEPSQHTLPAPLFSSPSPTTKRPAPAFSRDKHGGIHIVDPEGKKDCAVLNTGHLVLEFMNTSYCYTIEERRAFIRELVHTFNDLMEGAGVEYWIDSGTLLGVYRDNHLIPHDTDADVGLTQEGFRKLRQTKLEIPDNYELFIRDSPHYRPGPYEYLPGRFADKRTGLYADLFEFLPMQKTIQVPKNTTITSESKNQTHQDPIGNTSAHKNSSYTILMETEDVVVEFLAPLASIAWWSCAKCPEYRHFIVPTNWIFPLQRCTFEDKQVWCPANQKEYLTMLYGDNFMRPKQY